MVIGLGYFLLGTAPAYLEPIRSAQREEVASSTNDEGGMTKERQNPSDEKRCPVAPSSSKHSAIIRSFVI
jgi:hypothetical protein